MAAAYILTVPRTRVGETEEGAACRLSLFTNPRRRLFGRPASSERAFLVSMPQNPTHSSHAAAAQAQNTDLRSRIHALADEVASEGELYVVDVQVRGQKGSRVIEVYADADEGAGLDDLARLSRDLAFLLDTEDVVKGKYFLNVSSPGADRSLRLLRQYAQHVGRTLEVTTEADGEAVVRSGTLASVGDDHVVLEVDGVAERIAFSDVTDARVQLPW